MHQDAVLQQGDNIAHMRSNSCAAARHRQATVMTARQERILRQWKQGRCWLPACLPRSCTAMQASALSNLRASREDRSSNGLVAAAAQWPAAISMPYSFDKSEHHGQTRRESTRATCSSCLASPTAAWKQQISRQKPHGQLPWSAQLHMTCGSLTRSNSDGSTVAS